MFPKSSFVMMLVAGLLLLTASLVNKFSGNEINFLFLWIGVAFTVIGISALIIKKK